MVKIQRHFIEFMSSAAPTNVPPDIRGAAAGRRARRNCGTI
jgi:hypothetical protein